MSDTVTTIDIPMPQMGVSVTEGTLLAWKVAVGDVVEQDQTICEIATDKVDSEVPAPAAGTIAELLIEPGETVEVGTTIARMTVAGAAPTGPAPSGDASADDVLAASASARAEADGAAKNGRTTPGTSPLVRRIADDHGVDVAAVPGTGRNGRVTKKDILAFIADGVAPVSPVDDRHPTASTAAKPVVGESAPLSRMRQTIARNMTHSKATAPHAHTWTEVDMSRVEALRKPLGVTALAFVARATVEALRAHPAVNAWLEDDLRTIHHDVHLGIAVALDDEGLVVPVIRNAEQLSVEGLAAQIRDLATRARGGQLGPDEMRGGTFTITNPGRYGSLMAAPIINQPQVAILDMEAIAKRPVVITDEHGNDSLGIRPTSIFGLAWDHRAIDGALAAQFLATLSDRLQSLPRDA